MFTKKPVSRTVATKNQLADLAVFALLAAAIFAAYSNTFNAAFVLDDFSNILDVPSMRLQQLSASAVTEVIKNGVNQQRILPNLSFALNYYADGYNPRGYHLVNIAIHCLASFSLYFLFIVTLKLVNKKFHSSKGKMLAFTAALIWALHPLQTNAVTYIVQRMSSMAALFYFLALLFYISGRLGKKTAGHRAVLFVMAFACWACAILSKQNAVILPLVIAGYELFFLTPDSTRLTPRKLAPALLAGAALVTACIVLILGKTPLAGILAGYAYRDFSLSERLLTQTRIVVHYLTLLVLPVPSRLNLNYDFPLSLSITTPIQTLAAALAIFLLCCSIPFLFRRNRLLAFAIFWFIANLLIESSIIPLELIFEHRLYLPSAFLALALTTGAFTLLRTNKKILYLAVLGLVVSLAGLTWQRNTDWQDGITFWQDALEKAPKHIRIYVNLALAHESRGDYLETEKYLLQGLQILQAKDVRELTSNNKIDMAKLYDALAMVSRKTNNFPAAINAANRALHMNPALETPHITLGIIYETMGAPSKAIDQFEQAAAKGLESVDLFNNWAISLHSLGRTDEAIALLQKALALDPEHPESHYNLGIAYSTKGLLEEAGREMSLAMKLQAKGQ